tara:strand:- start:5673 stop:6437 length:765 start_codon:yes stop_codon:yes gene_type:complete
MSKESKESNESKESKEVYILGNGKSLEGFDFEFFKDKNTVGTCLAFRHWREIDWYPNHYVCVDSKVLKSNIESIKDLIENKRCETFLLDASIIKHWEGILQFQNVMYLQQLQRSEGNPFRYLIDWCSGSCAVLYSYIIGFNNLKLLGMDMKYVEFLPECEKQKDGSLKIIKEIKENPNYFINNYQQVGDIYNPPNTNTVHKKSWEDLRNILVMYNVLTREPIELTNYNSNKTLDHCFKRKELKEMFEFEIIEKE